MCACACVGVERVSARAVVSVTASCWCYFSYVPRAALSPLNKWDLHSISWDGLGLSPFSSRTQRAEGRGGGPHSWLTQNGFQEALGTPVPYGVSEPAPSSGRQRLLPPAHAARAERLLVSRATTLSAQEGFLVFFLGIIEPYQKLKFLKITFMPEVE